MLAFSKSSTGSGLVRAARIFEDLLGRRVWYVPRRSKDLIVGTSVLFYQAGAGVRGTARVLALSDATAYDRNSLREYGLYHLNIRIDLSDIEVFAGPIRLGPIVDQLDFISNKKYWGHSLRLTPRSISQADFEKIIGVIEQGDRAL
jgi:hypothetical protein